MSLFDKIFGKSKNPADAAMPYLLQQQQTLRPYLEQGQRVGSLYEDTAGQMAQNPQDYLNQLIESYQQSPAFNRQRDEALGALRASAASGGVAGSPQHQQAAGQLADRLAKEDMMSWVKEVLGIQGTGLNAQQNIYNTGFQGAQNIAESQGSQAGLAFQGQSQKNQRDMDILTGVLKLLGMGAGGAAGYATGGLSSALAGAQGNYVNPLQIQHKYI